MFLLVSQNQDLRFLVPHSRSSPGNPSVLSNVLARDPYLLFHPIWLAIESGGYMLRGLKWVGRMYVLIDRMDIITPSAQKGQQKTIGHFFLNPDSWWIY
jgi:hypothetical protein